MPVYTVLSEFHAALTPGRCLMGIDNGSVAIGVAVSDPGFVIASPVATITRKRFTDDAAAIVKIICERNVGGIVIGLPKNMDGSEGASAQSARALARNLIERGDMPDPLLPFLFWDERLSTSAVERFLLEDDMSRKRRDAVIDKAAAAYILQGALDALRIALERAGRE